MMRSMFAGISGLRNHQIRMDVIGNNIANVNTMGFKANRVNFQDIFSQTLRGPSSPTPQLGGTDPMQVGLGMAVASIDAMITPGNTQTTGQVTDMALQGDGYFVVSDGPTKFYTRAGDFKTDGTSYLTNSKGFRVLGWSAINGVFEPKDTRGDTLSEIRIMVGEVVGTQVAGVAWPTTAKMDTGNSAMLEGNNRWILNITSGTLRDTVSAKDLTITGLPPGLKATATKMPFGNALLVTVSGTADSPITTRANVNIVVNESAISEADAVASNPFALAIEPGSFFPPVVEATAVDPIVMMAPGDTTPQSLSSWAFDVTTGTLRDSVANSDIEITGLPAGLTYHVSKDRNGNRLLVSVAGSTAAPIAGPITANVVIRGSAMLETGAVNGPAIPVEILPDGTTPVKISARQLDADIRMDAGNQSVSAINTWSVMLDPTTLVNDPLGPGDITVSGLPAGLVASATRGLASNSLNITVSGTATVPVTAPTDVFVTVNPSAVAGGALGATASNPVRLTLHPVSATAAQGTLPTLKSYTVDSSGVITGSFSDGSSRAIAQVAVAQFSNPRGLIRQGDGLMATSNNSGLPAFGEAGTGGRGLIAPSSLEMSNVDLASEFTNMIITQRGFQANSRVITTSDEMLQELANIKR